MAPLWLVVGGLSLAYVALTYVILPLVSTQAKYLRSQQWIGPHDDGWFASYKNRIAVVTKTRSLVLEGYQKFSKHNKLFVLPQLSTAPIIVLPTNVVPEFLAKDDNDLDVHTLGGESIASKYTMGDRFGDGSHFDVVRRQLTRKLPLLTADVYSELVLSMQNQWPATAGKWTTVKVYPTCMKIVSRAANRVFSGAELCRNPDYLEHSRLYAQSVFAAGGLLKLVPKVLHPVVAPFLIRPVNKHRAICTNLSLPIIKDRLSQMEKLGKDYQPPNDVLQWILDDAITAPDHLAFRRNPEWISKFLLLLNMVAIHTTSIVISNTILDIYTAPSKDDIIAGLREEVQRVIGNGGWSKTGINNLLRVDSCIRETMRVQSLSDFGPRRLVKNPQGISLSNGIHLPYGVRVTVPAHAIHQDGESYPNAKQWDGFRFSRPREEFEKETETSSREERLEKLLGLKNQSLVTTTDQFFSFGFGKHACPGRFFASQEMKLMLAHIVMTYDIEMDGKRPENMLINGAAVPKDSFSMRIRLRS